MNIKTVNKIKLNTVIINNILTDYVESLITSKPNTPNLPKNYIINAVVTNGKVSASVNGKAVALPYAANAGDVIVLEVTANDGYVFDGWSDGNTDNPRSITMTADVTLSATCVVKAVEKEYIQFEDAEVERVLMSNGVSSDGVGITKEDAAAVTTIGTWFKGNTKITSFNEFERFTGVTFLLGTNEHGAFSECTMLESITLPSSLTEIRNQSFRSCASLKSINLGNITSIGGEAFVSTGSLNIVLDMPHLKSLGWSSFKNSGITEIRNLGSINVINSSNEHGTFMDCKNLTTVVLPNTLKTIQPQSFRDCTSLVTCIIPYSVTTIQNEAFSGCTSLSFDELSLPNLTSLDKNAFYGVKIKKLNLGKVTTLPSASSSTQNYGDKSVLEEVVIPDGVTEIPQYSFNGYAVLSKINFDWSKELGTIGDYAFASCPVVVDELTIRSVESIGTRAFYGWSIGKLVVKNRLTTLSSKWSTASFYSMTSLTLVDLPNTLTSIGECCFQRCSNLATFISRAETPPTLNTRAFESTPIASGTGYIYVPDAALEVYKTATNWSAYADRIHPLSELEGTPYITFADPEVERVLMENNVSSDGVGITMADAEAVTSLNRVFQGNTEIVSFDELNDFKGVTTINANEFKGCTSLTSIGLENITKVGNDGAWNAGAFDGCTSLERAIMPNVTEIANYAFSKCSSLAEAYMPNVTLISSAAFNGTQIGGSHTIPHCKTIGASAFRQTLVTQIIAPSVTTFSGDWDSGSFVNCKSLKKVMLRDATTLGERTFLSCSALESFVFANPTPPALNASLFSGSNSTFKIYVLDSSVDAYKAATNWSTFGNRIVPISQLATDNPTFYAEIEEYL